MKKFSTSFVFILAGLVVRILLEPMFMIPPVYSNLGILIVVVIMMYLLRQQFVKQETSERWLVLYVLSFLLGALILCPLAVKYYAKLILTNV